MRWTWALLFLPLLAEAAVAHGGCFGERPRGPIRIEERGIECDCGRVECDRCSTDTLRRGDQLFPPERSDCVLKRWDDVARCRTRLVFRARPERRVTEAHARLEPGPLFAAVAGELRTGDQVLPARLEPGEEARRKYLYGRRFMNADPLLILRRGPGRVDIRAYPVTRDVKVTVEIDGYVLVDCPPSRAPRIYRTADRHVAFVALAHDPHRDGAAFRDEKGGRSLHFLSRAECLERFGTDAAEDVPFVRALEAAVTGRGDHAASEDKALAALPANAPPPPFIGPDRVVTLPAPRDVRPGAPDDWADPEPPPPPAAG
jgi:hypothetical protein